MKPHLKYKTSGIEWLGNIPEHWVSQKIKFSDEVIMGQSPSSNDYNDNRLGFPFLQGNADFGLLIPIPNIWCETANKQSKPNDILLSVRAPIGAVNLSDQIYGIGRGLCAIRSLNSNYKFLFYTFLTANDELNSIGTGSTYTAISVDEVRDLKIPLPPLPEQKAIASFLDEKTKQIDTLIEKKQKMIELLKEERQAVINEAVTKGINPKTKMKDSGIEWLGEIPEHWEVSRMKYKCRIQGRIGFKGYKSSDLVPRNEGALTLGATHITKDHKIDLTEPVYLNWDKYFESPEIMVKQGDVLFTQRGAYLGKVALVDRDYGETTINPSLILLKNIDMNPGFLTFYLTSKYVVNNIEIISSDTAIPMISQEQLSNFYLPLPPLDEQEAIFVHIMTSISYFDRLGTMVERAIELLQEYRTALITEVVTGKVCVI
jgi:type I restriction enzyme S subunit